MTDNEIIKALECCTDCNCKECPCCRIIDGGIHCTEIDEEEILDLINRQKAEIERLQKKANTPFATITFDRDKLQEIVDECAENIEIDINLVKSEAIKEFAERLKEKLQWDVELENKIVFENDIDNLVKEMTEVNENGK